MSTSAGAAHNEGEKPHRAPERDLRGPEPDRGGHREHEEHESILGRQKEKYGGIKAGSAFFGWLTATGTAVLLTALAAAAGAVIGVATHTDVTALTHAANQNPQTMGMVGIIVLLIIVFIAYYCGGYVAGRMARFNGMKQGLVVWLWAVLIAIIVAILTGVAGSKFNILAQLNSFPRIPLNEGTLSTASIIAVLTAAAAALIGALLGGLAGMHFHRKVDRTGWDTGLENQPPHSTTA